MLRADELAAIRATVDAFLPDFCSISRGGVLLSPQPTMPDGSPLRCDVRPDKPVLIPGAGPLEHQEQWKIVLPDGTLVRAFDRIAALGNIYSVVLDPNPNSRSSQTNVYAIQLYGPDAEGNPTVPVYLKPNAVVSGAAADGTVRYTGRAVRLGGPPQPVAQNLPGGVVFPGDYLYDTPDATWTQDDQITILSQTGQTILPDAVIFRAARVSRPGCAIPLVIMQLEGGPSFGL